MYGGPERGEDNEHALIRRVCEQFGIAETTCARGMVWAKQWHRTLALAESDGVADTKGLLLAARDIASDELGTQLDRDDHGSATFRTRYAATELFLSLSCDREEDYRRILNGEGIIVRPDFKRLDEMLGTLLDARERMAFPYYLESAMLPQDERNMPPQMPRGGIEHANFLFHSCYYMRGGIKSVAAFRSLSRIYENYPELFDPHQSRTQDPEMISEVLQEFGLAYKKDEVGKAWAKNAARLSDTYDGDPRRIFEGNPPYDELLRRVKNNGRGAGFLGFREKMTSMLAYYLMADELVPYYDVPLPVDFHVLRVSAATGVVKFENLPDNGDIYHEKTLEMLRAIYHDYSVTHGIRQIEVCDAVWSLSSAICGEQPGNRMSEPNRSEGRDGRSTHILPMDIDINNSLQQSMYNKSCALCPLEEECELNFPSKAYYVKGVMVGSPRIRFPRTTLFGPEHF